MSSISRRHYKEWCQTSSILQISIECLLHLKFRIHGIHKKKTRHTRLRRFSTRAFAFFGGDETVVGRSDIFAPSTLYYSLLNFARPIEHNDRIQIRFSEGCRASSHHRLFLRISSSFNRRLLVFTPTTRYTN